MLEPVVRQSPDMLAHAAVGLLQVTGHLGQGLLAALVLAGHRARDPLVFGDELGVLGQQRDVLRPEQGDRVPRAARQHLVALRRQRNAVGQFNIPAEELVAPWLTPGVDVFDVPQVVMLLALIIRVAGGIDVAAGPLLVDARLQLAGLIEPHLELISGPYVSLDQVAVVLLDVRPDAEVGVRGDVLAGEFDRGRRGFCVRHHQPFNSLELE